MIKMSRLQHLTLLILFLLTANFVSNGQTNPVPQQLPYWTDFSSLSFSSTTYPEGWQGWTVGTAPNTIYVLNSPISGQGMNSRGYASNTTKGVYNYNGKIGFLNAADGDNSLVLALKTTGSNNIVVQYTLSTIRNPYNSTTNTRINGVELQYRVGTSGVFKSVNSAVYYNNTTTQTTATTTEQNRKIFAVELPSECSNQANVQVRWVSRNISGSGDYPSFAIDDVDIMSYGKAAYYYYDGSGSLNSVSNWGVNPDGSGERPQNFTSGYSYFVIKNQGTVVLDQNWTVSGDNSKVIIGDGVNTTIFKTMNSGMLTGNLDVRSASKIVIAQSTSNMPDFGNMYPGSSLEFLFAASLPYIPAASTFENLLLNSSGGHTYRFNISNANILIKKNFQLGNTLLDNSGSNNFKFQVGGNFTFTSGASLSSNFSNYADLTLSGASEQVITLNGIALNINDLTVNNPSGITLSTTGGSSNINVSSGTGNILRMAGGNIETGTNTITIGSSETSAGELSYVSGYITGNGKLERWFPKSGLPTSSTMAFPMGYSVKNRSVSLSFSNSSVLKGGKISVSHNNAPGSTIITPFSDGAITINKRSNMSWTVTQSGGWSMGSVTLNVKVRADGLEGVSDVSGLALIRDNTKAGGSFVSGTGSSAQPEVSRFSMSITDLGGNGSPNIFYIGASNSNPLPVMIGEFTASAVNRDAKLKWTTLNEVNNSGFEIERSKKSAEGSFGNWEKIGFVKGAGNSSAENVYGFDDKKLNEGVYRFRIKQVDYNGNYEYFNPSNQADLIIGKPASFEMSQNYPNPSNPVSKIDYQLPFDAKVSLRVYDISGQEVAVLVDGNVTAGFHTTEFKGSNLASGVYFYRIDATGVSGENFAKTMKMVLVK
jgi:hypothetical protein